MDQKEIDRYWSKVVKGPDCWGWNGSSRLGYGIMPITRNGKRTSTSAHRFSYELHYGPFDPKLFVCHTCDNRACSRPDHLFLGTHKDNMDDMWSKGRGPSSELVGEARRRARSGENVFALSQEYGVDYHCLVKSVRGEYHATHPEPPVPDADITRNRKVRKLSKEEIEQIQERLKSHYHGLSNELAKEYGVSHTAISLIRNGKYPGVSTSVKK